MSEFSFDDGSGEGNSPDSSGAPFARYTIHIPVYDNTHKELPHVLGAIRRALTEAGFPGRTVIRRSQGDWQGDGTKYETEETDLVMVDAPDTPENLDAIKTVGGLAKQLAQQEAIYITKQPIFTYLV